MSETRRAFRRKAALALSGIVVAAAAIGTLYPGWYSHDSAWLLMQARTHAYSNLQPPMMPLSWSVLLDIGLPPGSLLVAHVMALSLGLVLLAMSVRAGLASLLPLVILWPPFLAQFGHLWIDVTMAAALVVAVGWMAWCRAASRARLAWLAALPLAYAVAVRHNAVVAVVPLLFLLVSGAAGAPRKSLAKAGLTLALAAGAMGAFAILARQVVAIPMPAWTPTAIWDLSAASVASGRMLLPEGVRGPALTVEELRPLVNADTSMNVLVGTKSGVNPGIDSPLPPPVARELLQDWLRLPFTQTSAWASHRAGVAWSLLGPQREDKAESLFIVPQVVAYGDNPPMRVNDTTLNALLLVSVRAMKDTPLCAPLSYLLLAVLAAALSLRPRFNGDRPLVLALATSAWLHALPLVLIAPAAEFRYLLWPMIAGLLAFLLALDAGTAGRGARLRAPGLT